MCPQDACTIGQKIASITILLIFSAMAFQWFPHDNSTRAQKVTLIAFLAMLYDGTRWSGILTFCGFVLFLSQSLRVSGVSGVSESRECYIQHP